MPNYRVAITVVLDPVEGENADAASHIALELAQNALYSDNTQIPDELSKAIGDGTGEFDCMIHGAVASENTGT